MRIRRGLLASLSGLATLAGSIGTTGCQGPPNESELASGIAEAAQSSAARESHAVPKPIAGGDYFPASPHHRAGIIHQFYPADPSVGGDGPWVEPNEITDFNGFVAQVFMGGTAVDNKGNHYIVDVDNRVYRGEYLGTNGERAFGTFCEI
jgi:hypothetical protein